MRNNFILLVFALFFAQNCNALANAADDEFAEYEAEFSSKTQVEIYDPFESVNRKIFAFNDFLDIHLLDPAARAYRYYTPKPIRKSIGNFVTNLGAPFSAANSFFQGKSDNGLATCSSFLINSTLGIGGLFDVAGNKNIRYEKEDFGQTFGHYGMKSGPYLMIPIFGPSTMRDFSGFVTSSAIDPLSFNQLKIGGSTDAINANFRIASNLLYAIDLRESLIEAISDARKDSFDLYATFRSVYIQQRDSNIKK